MIGLVTALLVVAGGIAGYRVLAPGAILDKAGTAYPRTAPAAQPMVYGTLLAAPIVVDGRLRVYAGKQQVFADDPVNIKSTMSPFWSYRRWPAQLIGVVTVGTTVVSQWSDGEVVGLDATRGTVAWQAKLAVPGGLAFTGRRTGASTVWDPSRLYTAGQTVVAVGSQSVRGYDASTGRQLWQQPATACADTFTGPDVFVSVATCGSPAVHAYDARTGAALTWPQAVVQPVGCALGHSGCRGVRGSGGAWAIGSGGVLTAAPALAEPGVWVTDGVAIVPGSGGDVAGVGLADNKQLWTVTGRVIAVEPGAVHLVVDDPSLPFPEIITLDPATGQVLSGYSLNLKGATPFDLGQAYAADHFLFIERRKPGATPDLPDSAYFYPSPNVIVAGS
jgi:outer membrane protein assembly factor BamB